MSLASNVDNIRYNGTGRVYCATVGGSTYKDMGEIDKASLSIKVTTESVKSTRTAARGTILEVDKDRTVELALTLREMSEENMKVALLASGINTSNQSSGYVDQTTKTWVADEFLDTGYRNIFSTKLSHGTVTNGPFAVGDTVTGGTSSSTGKIAYKDTSYIEVIHVTGTGFVAGETITSSTKSATLSGVEVLDDPVITNSTGATRRIQGTDYSVDQDRGLIRKLSTGGLLDADKVSFDYEAVNMQYIHGMSAGSIEKQLLFVADKDDLGPRQDWILHRVKLALNGDVSLLGEGMTTLSLTGSVLFDSTQPSGQEYFKLEMR
jgi:hypothetical protein